MTYFDDAALVRKNQIVKRKLMTSVQRLKRELEEVKEKSALQCEEKQKNCGWLNQAVLLPS